MLSRAWVSSNGEMGLGSLKVPRVPLQRFPFFEDGGARGARIRGSADVLEPWRWWGFGRGVQREASGGGGGLGGTRGGGSLLTLVRPFLQPTSHTGLGASGRLTGMWG